MFCHFNSHNVNEAVSIEWPEFWLMLQESDGHNVNGGLRKSELITRKQTFIIGKNYCSAL